jgi:hypothetical protein
VPHTTYEPGAAPLGGAVGGEELLQFLPLAEGAGLVVQFLVLPKDQDTRPWYAEQERFDVNAKLATNFDPGVPDVGETVAVAVSALAAIALETRTSAAIAAALAHLRDQPAIRRVSVRASWVNTHC